MKKCLFRSTHWCTVINLCNLCKLHNLQKLFSIWVQSAKWRNVFSDLHIGVPLSICIICANCTICKSCFQFECNLQNEEMSFRIYSLEDRTVINLRNLCILHNLQKLFSIWVEFAKRRNVFSDLLVGGSYPYQFVQFLQIAQFPKAVFNLSAIWKMKKCLFRSTRWRIIPLSICIICANCSICKSGFQFECNLQNEEMSFQVYKLEYRYQIV